MRTNTVRIDEIVFSESYVLGIRKGGEDVFFQLEFLFDDGYTGVGSLVFCNVRREEWRTATGEPTTLENLIESAHRYHGGPEEPADLGTINSVVLDGGGWKLVGDWGECQFQADTIPEILIE